MSLIRVLTLLTLGSWAAMTSAHEWSYGDPYSSKYEVLRFSESRRMFYHGDIAEPWLDCSKTNQAQKYRVCIQSDSFRFGVPLDVKAGAEWSIDGDLFRASGAHSIQLLGKVISDVFVIEQKNHAITYLYSSKQGLIGMYQLYNGEVGILWLKGTCGLGADQTCYRHGRRK